MQIRFPQFSARGTTASKPCVAVPPEAPGLDAYVPHLGHRMLAGGIGLATAALSTGAGVAVGQASVLLAAGLGAAAGAALGYAAAQGIEHGLSSICGLKPRPFDRFSVGSGVVGALLVGGLTTAASMLPTAALGVVGAVAGVAAGFGLARVYLSFVDGKRTEKMDQRSLKGEVRVSRLFRDIADRAGDRLTPQVERDVRACERLEAAGWRLATTRDALQNHADFSSPYDTVEVHTPSGQSTTVTFRSLPTLAYQLGTGEARDVDNAALVDVAARHAEQGRVLQVMGQDDGPHAPDLQPAKLANSLVDLVDGKPVAVYHEGVPIRVAARDERALEAEMTRVARTAADYDAHLAPLFVSGAIDATKRVPVASALIVSPLGVDLTRAASAFLELMAGSTASDVAGQTASALLRVEARTTASMATLATRGSGRYLPAVLKRVDGVFAAEADKRSVMARVAKSVLNRADHPLGASARSIDSAVFDAMRDPRVSTESALAEYERMLATLTRAGMPEEAAPTYAYIRSGLEQGRFRSDATTESLIIEFAEKVVAGGDPQRARQTLGRTAAEAGTIVQQDANTVVIGGIKIAVNR